MCAMGIKFHKVVYRDTIQLSRWGGNRLYDFSANLFRKRCTKFHQNHPSFIQ